MEEHITVVQGRLHARPGQREVILEAGDSLTFRADLTHEFRNLGAEPCHYFLIIDAGRVGTPRTVGLAGTVPHSDRRANAKKGALQ